MALLDNLRDAPDRGSAVTSYAKLAPLYDASCRWLNRIRMEALDVLDPSEGDTILDVACGTGAMLPALACAVGPRGRVIGIEQCPEMAAIARRRISDAALENVILVVALVEEAEIGARADAILFCYTHDVLQSDRAVSRVLSCARPGSARGCRRSAFARLVGRTAQPLEAVAVEKPSFHLPRVAGSRGATRSPLP